MNLILFLFAFVIQRKTRISFSYAFDRWSKLVVTGISARFARLPEWCGALVTSIVFLSVIAGLWGVLSLLQGIAYDVFYFFVVFLVILSLIGDADSAGKLDEFLTHWRQRDSQGALLSLLSNNIVPGQEADSSRLLLREVANWLLLDTFQRYFLILFWFAVAGPTGALAARIVEQVCRTDSNACLVKVFNPILFVLEAVPCRIVAIAMVFLSDQSPLNWQFFRQVIFGRFSSDRLLLVSAQVALPEHNLGKRDRLVKMVVSEEVLLQEDFDDFYLAGDTGIKALRVLLTQVVWGCFFVWALVQLGVYYFPG
ncbi:MAG: hypothetical protein CSB48_12225 [Proteobacteria bacterium]|nr:MAG: hypothetical protein CSB48_12225 [Pseudomonadota bacterium]